MWMMIARGLLVACFFLTQGYYQKNEIDGKRCTYNKNRYCELRTGDVF